MVERLDHFLLPVFPVFSKIKVTVSQALLPVRGAREGAACARPRTSGYRLTWRQHPLL